MIELEGKNIQLCQWNCVAHNKHIYFVHYNEEVRKLFVQIFKILEIAVSW